jgi:hypothetical protein
MQEQEQDQEQEQASAPVTRSWMPALRWSRADNLFYDALDRAIAHLGVQMAEVPDGLIPGGIQVSRLEEIGCGIARGPFVKLNTNILEHVHRQMNKQEEKNY